VWVLSRAKLEAEGCNTRSETWCHALLTILGKMSVSDPLQKPLFRVFLSIFTWRKIKIAWPRYLAMVLLLEGRRSMWEAFRCSSVINSCLSYFVDYQNDEPC